MSFTHAVQRGLSLLEEAFTLGATMPAGDRAALGLTPGPRPANRRKGGAL